MRTARVDTSGITRERTSVTGPGPSRNVKETPLTENDAGKDPPFGCGMRHIEDFKDLFEIKGYVAAYQEG
jgi:hypothetical protein